MGENTKIEWTDHTFNPWIGCTKVSPGCDHCYAEERMDKHFGQVEWGPGCRAALTNSSLRMLEQSGSWKILPPDGRVMQRVGKHKAGRLLDGKEHTEFPS